MKTIDQAREKAEYLINNCHNGVFCDNCNSTKLCEDVGYVFKFDSVEQLTMKICELKGITYEAKKKKIETFDDVLKKASRVRATCDKFDYCDECTWTELCSKIGYACELSDENLASRIAEHEGIKNESECFWMVKRIDSGATSHMHQSYDSAEKEAKRLASTNPGKKFAVLKAVCYFQTEKPEVKKVEL